MFDSKVSPSSDIYLNVWNIYTKSRGLLARMAAIRDDNGKVIPEKYSGGRLTSVSDFSASRGQEQQISK